MNKMVVLTKSDQVDGFRLAGVDAIGVDDIEAVENMIKTWLGKRYYWRWMMTCFRG
jgi:vacuolar-type H+-ATPase subunit F/Vma7